MLWAGGMSIAQEVAKELKKEGIFATLVDARFIKPLDIEGIIEICSKCQYVLTIEEGVLMGGFGSSILEVLSENNLHVNMIRIGIPDEFIEQGKIDQLLTILIWMLNQLLKK